MASPLETLHQLQNQKWPLGSKMAHGIWNEGYSFVIGHSELLLLNESFILRKVDNGKENKYI